MSLEPGLKTLLEIPGFQLSRPPAGVTAAELRAATLPMPQFPVDPVHEVRDIVVPVPGGQVAVRLVRPHERTDLPLIVHFHGGGFVFCNLDTHEPLCRTLAQASGCVVASVDYRLAPENPFPVPLEDCYHATQWLAAHARELGVDAGRIAVAGDSAGGNLATAVVPPHPRPRRRSPAPPGAHLPGDRCRLRQRFVARAWPGLHAGPRLDAMGLGMLCP